MRSKSVNKLCSPEIITCTVFAWYFSIILTNPFRESAQGGLLHGLYTLSTFSTLICTLFLHNFRWIKHQKVLPLTLLLNVLKFEVSQKHLIFSVLKYQNHTELSSETWHPLNNSSSSYLFCEHQGRSAKMLLFDAK